MTRRRRRVFQLLAFGLALLAVEGGVRIAFLRRGHVPPTADASLEAEWEWARIHLAAGTPVMPGDEFAFDRTLGWCMKPNVRLPGITTNAEGFRDTRDFPEKPAPRERRVVLVGDSFTFGHGNPDGETYAAFLQEALGSSANVLNFGVPSYGADQALLMFEERARSYEPRVVVLGFFLHDYVRNLVAFREGDKPLFVPEGQDDLRLANVPLRSPEEIYRQYASRERVVGEGVHVWAWGAFARSVRKLDEAWFREGASGLDLLRRLMIRFQRKVRASGAEPVWLVLPNDDDVYTPSSHWAKLDRLVVSEAERLGLRVVTATPALRAAVAEAPGAPIFQTRTGSGHFTARANRIVASELAEALRPLLDGAAKTESASR